MSVTHALVSAKADGPDDTLVRPSDWNREHVVDLGWKDVRDYAGVDPAGLTDSTTGLQAAFDALQSSITAIYIPPGTYKISDTLTIPYVWNRRIYGAGRWLSTIEMTANNKPIIATTAENTHTLELSGLGLTYATQQTSADTAAYGLCFRRTSDAYPPHGAGWYFWNVHDLNISKAHIAVGIGGPGMTGVLGVWNTNFERVFTKDISMTLLRLVSPTTAGMPINTVRNWTHLGQTTANAGPAFEASAAEMYYEALDVEDWHNALVFHSGNTPLTVNGLHVERHVFDANNKRLFDLWDKGGATLTNLYISGSATSAVGTGVLVKAATTDMSVVVSGLVADFPVTGGGLIAALDGSGQIWASGLQLSGTGVSEYLVSGYGTGLYARVLVNGLPPIVDALPAASATYRGRRFRVLGTTDVESECSNVASSYAWVTK